MDYNEWLLNYYVNNISPMTVSSDFRDTVGLISSGSIVTEFAGIAIDYVGEDAV